MVEWLDELSSLPRDGVLVTTMEGVAKTAEAYGRRVLLMGRDFHGHRELRDGWSEMTRRVGIAQVIGPEWLADATQHFANCTHINRITSTRRARRWASHLIRNLLLLAECPHGMRTGAFAGLPAFVVGAGPSLDRNQTLLHYAPGPVIRVNAASKAAPGDITLSVESNDLTEKLATDGVQCLGITSPPALLQRRPLRPIWAGEIAWVPELLTGVPRLPSSGGGTSAAVSLALRWGCDPIVLVGQDLAWTDGRVYAKSTGFNDRVTDKGEFVWAESARMPRPENPLPDSDDLHEVTAWGGHGTVRCGTAHQAVRMWLAAFADSSPVRCINATEGGGRVPGWAETDLDDVCIATATDPGGSHRARDWAGDMAGELIARDEIIGWLHSEAPQKLAEAWAYRSITERVDQHRERAPSRIPFVEAYHVRQAKRDVEDIVSQAQGEIRRLVEDVVNGCV